MANQTFQLAENISLSNSAVTGNGTFTIFTSAQVNNNNGIQGMRLIIDYSNPNPVDINVTAIVESFQGGVWYPIAYQFNPFNNVDNGKQRIIALHPTMSTFNSGIDDDVYVGGAVLARISRQQGKVGSNFRVRLVVNENNHGTANAFQGITVSINGELYD